MQILSFITIFLGIVSYSSKGDEEEEFQQCLQDCNQKGQMDERNLSLHLRLFLWNHDSDCKYECMWKRVEQSKLLGLPIHQYYGKWPFIRIFGIQEVFSVVFSILNIMAHYYGYKRFVKKIGKLPLMILFYLIGLNSWIWSILFHTRDVRWTERMDYFSANAVLFYSLYLCIIMIMKIENNFKKRALFIIFSLFYFRHIWYLGTVKFDYAYNMKLMILIGFTFNLLWCFHGLRYWNVFSHSKWIVIWTACCVLSATMEVFDFEPILNLLDAHSIWHGLTAPLTLAFYRLMEREFQIKDSKYSI